MMDAAGPPPHPGGGLEGLQDRLEALDGDLMIASPPGGPTRIRLHLPWTTEERTDDQ